jgi:hypothetical protein
VTATAALPVEGELPGLGGATAWLNSAPLTPAGLRGTLVVVQFCTLSCINWLRTVPYVRAWADKYRDAGLVVIGAHSPEFPFEHDLEKVRCALEGMGIGYPIALDNRFAVWRAFDNAYWPELYFVDVEGRIRHHRFGEEDYVRSERVVQQLLTEAGRDDVDRGLVSVEPDGVYLAADWDTLGPRRPTSAMPGQRASRHRGASCPTAGMFTSSRPGSGSTSGHSRVTGRWVTRPRP